VVPFNDGYGEVVITNDATGIGTNRATLNGTLVHGIEVESGYCWFQYGETTDYGTTTDSQYIKDGASFSQLITGLKPNTLYHFIAGTGAFTAWGEDKTFRTRGAGNPNIDQLIYQHVERMQR